MDGDTQVTLLDRLREAPDPLAWQDFFDRYWRTIFALARHLGCQDQSADDVVQEVLLALFQQRHVFRYDPARGRFRDWLAAVVRNTVARRRRRREDRLRGRGHAPGESSAEPLDDQPAADAACQAAFEDALLGTILDIARREVSPQTYQAFELAVLHDMPGALVAKVTGLSRNAVYKARARVLERLQELGLAYGRSGQLTARLKQVLHTRPPAAVQRSIVSRIEESVRAQWESAQ
jgi:RNA polymerase sigma-70 factor, ECF subfamily